MMGGEGWTLEDVRSLLKFVYPAFSAAIRSLTANQREFTE